MWSSRPFRARRWRRRSHRPSCISTMTRATAGVGPPRSSTSSSARRPSSTRRLENHMADLVTCPSCGAQYLASASVCAECATPLGSAPHLAPNDDEEEVGYDLSDWSADERAQLAGTLAGEGIPSRWEDDELVVRATDADHVEALID